MQIIDSISNEASQKTQVILEDGTTVDLIFAYQASIGRWSFNVSRGTFAANGINLCVSPNMLRPWKNVIPFGLACVTTDGQDPVYIDDFSNGRASIYILDQDEVNGVETVVFDA